MSIQTDPPRVTQTTTVANISTTQRFPVERTSTGQRAPQTRPEQAPKPMAQVQQSAPAGISKAPSALRNSLEAAKAPRPADPATARRIIRGPVYNAGAAGDPPDEVGYGRVPPGAVKVR